MHTLVATTTLAMGVNLPVDNVVINHCGLGSFMLGEGKDATMFNQIVGRAGRRGMTQKGYALMLVDDGTEEIKSTGFSTEKVKLLCSKMTGDAANIASQIYDPSKPSDVDGLDMFVLTGLCLNIWSATGLRLADAQAQAHAHGRSSEAADVAADAAADPMDTGTGEEAEAEAEAGAGSVGGLGGTDGVVKVVKTPSSSRLTLIELVSTSLFARLEPDGKDGLEPDGKYEQASHESVRRLLRKGLAHASCQDSEVIEPSDFGHAVQSAGFSSVDSAIAIKEELDAAIESSACKQTISRSPLASFAPRNQPPERAAKCGGWARIA